MKEFTIDFENNQQLKVKTNYIAKQANGSVLVQKGETVVLAAVVMSKKDKEGLSFFPLSVEYREKTYAAGKIPGGFFKREGKPMDNEVLSSRKIDRPIRPLFPDWLKKEVQISVTVLSYDGVNPSDSLGIIAASTALMISDIPFDGPVSGIKLVMEDNKWFVNPQSSLDNCQAVINMAGKDKNVVMLEGELDEISEEKFLEGIDIASSYISKLSDFQRDIAREVGKEKLQPPEEKILIGEDDKNITDSIVEKRFNELYEKNIKKEKEDLLSEIKDEILSEYDEEDEKLPEIKKYIEDSFKKRVRDNILEKRLRADNRDPDQIRPISIEIGILPRVHGSAIFTRGETQAVVTTTLGTSYDEQIIDNLEGDNRKKFMLHYNFPPYSVGEIGFYRSVSRREIGHGHLAEISLSSVLPETSRFPYTIRIVSEITESNGSSSMATVCGSTLSLLDAGVPLKKPVAGIAMGLVTKNDDYVVLTDILGMEDHWGDMDLKVTGTKDGITAIQMDLKMEGLKRNIFADALKKAKVGRLSILDKITEVISEPRNEVSKYAPKIGIVNIKPEKIGSVIGSGGKTIKAIQEETASKIEIDDSGLIKIFGFDKEKVDLAKSYVNLLSTGPRKDSIYPGRVIRIEKYGMFIELAPGIKGLLHVSQMKDEKELNNFNIGDEITVKIVYANMREGKVNLTDKI